MTHTKGQKVVAQLEALPGCNRARLQEHWTRLFGSSPPPKIDRSLLIHRIAYRIQEQAFGALKPSVRCTLDRLAGESSAWENLEIHQRLATPAGDHFGSSMARDRSPPPSVRS